jgi:hypothetical protein
MKDFKKIKRVKKTCYLLKNRARHFLRRTEKILLREMKEQDLQNLWKYLGSFKTERSYEEEGKIFLCSVSIFFLAALIISGNFIFTNNFNIRYGMANAQANEISDLKISENNKLNTDVEAVNEYKLKSLKEICTEAKGQKQSSGLCGKDDEEELQKIADEARIKKHTAVARKPKIKAPMPYVYDVENGRKVCNKKNDHPSNSDKGSHKPGHMDMECCLDPDEIPNPNCYYSQSKYGKYLD